MKRLGGIAGGLALCALVIGCASVTRDECLAGNWEEIGYRDGTNGRTQDYIARHAKACARVDVVPDTSAWNAARLRGVPVYCVPQRAYSEGRMGRDVSPVCSADVMPALQEANQKGQRHYEITQEIQDLQDKIGDLESDRFEEKDRAKRFVFGLRIRNLESRIKRLEDQRQPYEFL